MDLKKIGKLVLGLVLIAGLVYIGDFSRAVSEISTMNLWLYGAAVAVFMAGIVIGGLRWLLLNRVIGEKITVRDSIKVYLVNYSLSTVFLGNLADLGRYKIQERYVEVENKYSLTGAVVVEKILDLVAVTSVIGVSISFLYTTLSQNYLFVGLARAKSFIRNAVGEGSIVINEMREDRVSSFYIVILSLMIWWLEAVAFYAISISIGAGITFFEAAITTSLMSLASTIPVTPSGLGTTESTGYALLSVFGIASGPALALIVGQRFLGVVISSIPGVVIYFNDYMN